MTKLKNIIPLMGIMFDVELTHCSIVFFCITETNMCFFTTNNNRVIVNQPTNQVVIEEMPECQQCHQPMFPDDDPFGLGVCEDCCLDHGVGHCDSCDCIIVTGEPMLGLPEGTYYPVPPNTDHNNDNYFLCSECFADYEEQYPDWTEWEI